LPCTGTGRPLLVRSRWKASLILILLAAVYVVLSNVDLESVTVLIPRGQAYTSHPQKPDSDSAFFREGKRKFSIRSDQMAATEINGEGSALWTREFPTLLTSASVGKELSAWGLLDGRLLILDANGALAADNPDLLALGLVYETDACMYGVGISPDGNSLLVLFGRNPQYLMALRREGTTYKVRSSLKMKENVTTSSQIAFSADGSSALARTGDGLLFFNARRTRFSHVMPASEARSLRIYPRDADGFTVLLSGDTGVNAVIVRSNLLIARMPVEAAVMEFMLDDSGVNFVSGTGSVSMELGRR